MDEQQYIVRVTYNTDENNKPVLEGEPLPETLHGPFNVLHEAHHFADTFHEDDTDISDAVVLVLNAPEPT